MHKSRHGLLLLFSCLLSFSAPTWADTPDHQAAKFASGAGNILYLAVAVGLPLTRDGRNGSNHSLRTLDALGTSVILSEGLKLIIREKRPDSDSHDSFPSGHATAAFAVATAESQWHPKEAALWFTGATLIAASRVRLHRHFLQDVLAGALLGYGTARLTLSQRRGVLLAPVTGYPHTDNLQMESDAAPASRGIQVRWHISDSYGVELTHRW